MLDLDTCFWHSVTFLKHLNLILMKKIKNLLTAILAELRYMRKCRVVELNAKSIIPPGTPPPDKDPEE